jgi:hypothetical protein
MLRHRLVQLLQNSLADLSGASLDLTGEIRPARLADVFRLNDIIVNLFLLGFDHA